MSKYQAVSLQTRWYCMSYFLLFNWIFAKNRSLFTTGKKFKQIRNVLSQNVKLIENLLSRKENVKQIGKRIFPLSFACPFSLSRSRIKRSRQTYQRDHHRLNPQRIRSTQLINVYVSSMFMCQAGKGKKLVTEVEKSNIHRTL